MDIIYCQSKQGWTVRTKDINPSSQSQPHPSRTAWKLWLVKPRSLANVQRKHRAAEGAEFGDWVSCAGLCLISEGVWCLVSSCPPLSALSSSPWIVTRRFSQEKPLSLAQQIGIYVGLQRKDKSYHCNYRNRANSVDFPLVPPSSPNQLHLSLVLPVQEETTRAGWACGGHSQEWGFGTSLFRISLPVIECAEVLQDLLVQNNSGIIK